jgi:hypothetical protein
MVADLGKSQKSSRPLSSIAVYKPPKFEETLEYRIKKSVEARKKNKSMGKNEVIKRPTLRETNPVPFIKRDRASITFSVLNQANFDSKNKYVDYEDASEPKDQDYYSAVT